MRGEASHRRNRYTLHKKHLEAFKEWFNYRDGWKIQEPTGHPHEVLFAIKYCREGTEDWAFIYKRDRFEHLTVQAALVPYVRQWLKERKK
jgi:hypothetical protein